MLNNTVDNILVFNKESTFLQDNLLNPNSQYNKQTNKSSGDIHFAKYYINNLHENVTVVERSGIRQVVENRDRVYHNYFNIVTEINFNSNAIGYFRQIFNDCDLDNCEELSNIKEAFDRKVSSYTSARGNINFTLVIETRIYKTDFNSTDKDLYVNKHDIVVSLKSLSECSNHPFANNAVSRELFSCLDSTSGYKISFDLVDNDNKFGDRYFCISKKLIKLKGVKNPTKENGVHVTTMSTDNKTIVSEFYTVEEAEEQLGLYNNISDAKSAGDLKTANQTELAELIHKNKLLEQVNAERENIQKEKIKALDAANIEAQAKLDERKANIDEEVYNRTQKSRIEAEEAKAKAEESKAKQEAAKSWLTIVTIVGTALTTCLATYIGVSKKIV